MKISRRIWIGAAAGAGAGAAGVLWASSGRRGGKLGPSEVRMETEEGRRLIASNGLPEHATGDFPNRHDPEAIRAQSHAFTMPARPEPADSPTDLNFWLFGVAVNGVPFDPSGPFWDVGDGGRWQFEVLCPSNAVALGIDVNRAHTQAGGMYHYHGLPTGLYWELRRRGPERPMHLLGFAADGFPIYGPEAPSTPEDPESPVRRLRSSYRIRAGRRPDGPGGRYDGTFVEDFEYDPGLGDLDEFNGRTGPTPEFPDGTYYYVLTDEFPFIPRHYRGTPDASFRHGPPPGFLPPVPPELRGYVGVG